MKSRIIFICTGNICRSPIAEAVAIYMFSGVELGFSSAGLSPVTGHEASLGSREFVDELGISLDNHQSRPVMANELAEAVWVIGMTRSHAAIFRGRYRTEYQGKIGILGAPGLDLSIMEHSPEAEEVDDPYGLSHETYQATGRQIQRLLEPWRPFFQEAAAGNGAGS